MFQGRLSLVSTSSLMLASQAAAMSIFYVPDSGTNVTVYKGSIVSTGGVLSIVLGNNWVANTLYDVFVAIDGSTLRLCTGPAWTNSGVGTSARGTGAGTTELDFTTRGYPTNANSMTCRYGNAATFTAPANEASYLGTFITGAAGQVNFIYGANASGGVAAFFGIWNYYNRVIVPTAVIDSGTSYSYTSATVRQARASAGNQISMVVGVQGDGLITAYSSFVQTAAVAGAGLSFGVGLNSTATYASGGQRHVVSAPTADAFFSSTTQVCHLLPALGLNVISGNENGDGANANIFNLGSGGVGQNTLGASVSY